MKKLLFTLSMLLCMLNSIAQEMSKNLVTFIEESPWELKEDAFLDRYQSNIISIPDTLHTLIQTNKFGDHTLTPNIIGGFTLDNCDAYIGYSVDEMSNNITFIGCILNPFQTLSANIEEILVNTLGEPIPDAIPEDSRQTQNANGASSFMYNMWDYNNATIVHCSFSLVIDASTVEIPAILMIRNSSSDKELEELINDNYRLKFRGIPINGQLHDFHKKLVKLGYHEDYSFTPRNSTAARYIGMYGGRDCTLYIYVTPQSNTVYQVRVIIGDTRSWWSLKNTYHTYKEGFTKKYGAPWMCEENFEYPYEDGDGLELRNIEKGKATYYTSFHNIETTGLGYIDLVLNASHGEGWLSIDFKDGYNMLLNEEEMTNSL